MDDAVHEKLAALEARVRELESDRAELERRVRELEDDRAVRELLARYGYNADACRDDAYVELFTEDGAMDLTVGNLPEYAAGRRWEGRDAIREFISDPVAHHHPDAYGKAMHVMGNNLVVHLSGDQAVVNSYSLNIRKRADGFAVQDAANNQWTLQRIGGRWLIKERRRRQVGDPQYTSNLDATPA